MSPIRTIAALAARVRARDSRSWRRAGGRNSAPKPARGASLTPSIGHAGHAQSRRQRRQQLPAHQRRLHAEALLSAQSDQRRQCEAPAPGLDLPDRRQGIDGDLADRRERRHVRHDVVQPRLRAQRPDRRAALALQARDRADHDLLLRAEQSRRRRSTRTRSISPRSTPSWSRSTPRPATRSGSPTSPIPSSATARPWRRPSSRAKC